MSDAARAVVLYVDDARDCQITLSEWATRHGYAVVGIERYWATAVSAAVRAGASLLARTARDVPMPSLASALRHLAEAGLAVLTLDDGELAPNALDTWLSTGSLRTPR